MPRPQTPLLAVDIIIELAGRTNQSDRSIVLIERRNPPHGWALPGGFVDVGESLEHAAVREAKEETGLEISLKVLLGCYSNPARDARGHTVSAVYVAEAAGEPRAGDDAGKVKLVNPLNHPKLAFDHALILSDYCRYRETGILAPLRD
ncbi:MAG: NUDIX domain-containing protein [Gammaproteobacteria bacterium]